MPLLRLADRPDDVRYAFEHRRPGIGSMASAVTHGVAVLLGILAIQAAREVQVAGPRMLVDSQRLIWMPNEREGGGRAGGGSSTAPARKQELPGASDRSIATTPDQTTESANEPLLEILPIAAVPVGSTSEFVRGVVASDSATDGLGLRDGPGGDGAGPTIGAGKGSGSGIGDPARAGGPGVTTPVPILQVKPQYTAEAMRAKVQGLVLLECVVLPDGTVGEARVTRSLDPLFGLDQQAIAAARRWRFKPGLLNGVPVPVRVTIELTFTVR